MSKKTFTLALFVFSFFIACAQTFDNTFAPYFAGPSEIKAMVKQADDKIIIAGTFVGIGSTYVDGGLVRLNTDGTVDNTFNIGTGPNSTIYDLALEPDGQILVAGAFTTFNEQAKSKLIRLNSDGSIDNTFSIGTGPNINPVQSIAVQTDGKIIARGYFDSFNGTTSKGIVRLNSNGTVDTGFSAKVENLSGSSSAAARMPIVIQSDNKIIIGGEFTKVNDTNALRLARLNTDGTLDATFMTNLGTGLDDVVADIALQSTGKIVFVGNFTKVNSASANFNRIARLDTNGTVDGTFTANAGFNSGNYLSSLKVLASDKIIVGGNFQTPKNRIIRLDANGAVDNAFAVGNGLDMINTNPDVYEIVEQTDNKVIIAGRFIKYDATYSISLARIGTNGSIDATYVPNPSGAANLTGMKVLSDGKILVCGDFIFVNGTYYPNIVKLNADGTNNNTFTVSGFTINGGVIKTVDVQSDGKIIIAGTFYYSNGANKGLARLASTGAYDNTFSGFTTLGMSSSVDGVYTIHVESDDKITIGGSFTTVNGTAKKNLARLASNGALDNTFNPNNDFTNGIYNLDVRASDGRIILTERPPSIITPSISLAEANGTKVSAFNINSKFNGSYLRDAVFLPDGKILIGGDFSTFDGSSVNRLVKVDDAGAKDATFSNTVSYTNYEVRDLFVAGNRVFVGKGLYSGSPTDANYFDVMAVNGSPIDDALNITASYISLIVPTGSSYFLGGSLKKVSTTSVGSLIKVNFPAAPTGNPSSLAATTANTPRRVSLTWTDNSSTETSFEIQRSVTNNSNFVTIATVSANITSYSDQTGLSAVTTYYYRVRAVNPGGETGFSNEINITTLPNSPAAPSSLAVQSFTQTQIVLTWTDNSNDETGFEVYGSTPNNSNYTLLQTVSAGTTTYTHSGLTANTNYFYKLRAINTGGNSAYTSEISKTTLDSTPSAPSSLAIQSRTHNQIVLTWTDNSNNETGFEIFRSSPDNLNYALITTTSASATTFTNTSLSASTHYYYKVRAINLGGSSSFTSEVSGVTTSAPPSALSATAISMTKIRLNWTDNSSAETGFKIYKVESGGNVLLITLGANSTELVVDGLSPSTSYTFLVKASDSEGESAASNSATATTPSVSSGEWGQPTTVNNVPARNSAIAFVIGGKAYVGLGRNAAGALKDFWEFDPVSNTWTPKTDFPGNARIGAVAFVINGKGYVGTGNDFSGNGFLRDFYEYDPIANTWTKKADFPEDFNAAAGITSGAAFSIGNFGYVGLGNTGLNNTTAFYRYDPVNNVWQARANFGGQGRIGAAGFANNGKGYFAFGYGGLSPTRKDLWEYDPTANTWTQKSDFISTGRGGISAFTINGQAFLVAGEEGDFSSTVRTNKVSQYDFQSSQWTILTPFPAPIRTSAVAFAIGTTGYIFSGSNSSTYYNDLVSYKPGSAFLPVAPNSVTASYLSDSSVKITWTDASDNETGFVLEVSVNGSGFSAVTTVSANTSEFTHTGLTANTQYNYRIRAQNIYGTSQNILSNTVFTTAPPAAPSNLNGSALSSTSIKITWTDNSSTETGFEIYRTDDGVTYVKIASVNANAVEYTNTGLTFNKDYTYKVLATGINGNSSFSAPKTIKTLDVLPASPTTLQVVSKTQSLVELKWTDNSSNESGFKVMRKVGTGVFELLNQTSQNIVTYTDNTVAPFNSYTYRVVAFNGIGESGFSEVTAAVSVTEAPEAPSEVKAELVLGPKIQISWKDNSLYEDGFDILREDKGSQPYASVGKNTTTFSDATLSADLSTYKYSVRAKNAIGTSAYTEFVSITLPPGTVTGIEDEATIEIVAYPNPIRDRIVIVNKSNVEARVSVINQLGVTLSSKVIAARSEATIDSSEWSVGIYLLQADHQKTQRIFKK